MGGLVSTWGKVMANVNDSTYKNKKYVRKTVTFTGGASAGAVGTINLFSVTGNVRAKLTAVCTENLVSAGGGTLEVGISGNTASIIAQTAATDIDNGETWKDASPDANPAVDDVMSHIIANGSDIIATVGTDAITDGTIVFDLEYEAMDATGAVAAA